MDFFSKHNHFFNAKQHTLKTKSVMRIFTYTIIYMQPQTTLFNFGLSKIFGPSI